MTRDDIKLMIITNFIEYYTTDDEERNDMGRGAEIYVEEDHVDEIGQSFPETTKPNGFESWIETFYEIVDHFTATAEDSISMGYAARERGGRAAQYTLAEQLADEFENSYDILYFDENDFVETMETFLSRKESQHWIKTSK